jgi:hypothetical protein
MNVPTRPNLEAQDRDLDLLRGLLDSRLMTIAHAAAIHFEGRIEAAKKRLQKLKAAGLIGQRKRKPYEPSILFLARPGFLLLRERGLLHDFPQLSWTSLEKRLQVSNLTLNHELEVTDVKAAFAAAINKEPAFEIIEYSTWPVLFQFRSCPGCGPDVLVKPDSFIRIHEREGNDTFEHTFFVEVDRSTETQEMLARRALCYLDYYRRGGLAERFGSGPSEYKDFPFRVLMIFKNAERRNNAAERLLTQHPPIFTQVWLSTLAEVKANPLGPIWIRPRDYRDVVHGTSFDVERARSSDTYRRQPERERLVESTIQKLCLLSTDTDSATQMQ